MPNTEHRQRGEAGRDCFRLGGCQLAGVFITGQSPFRTGLLKVGLPGADLGLRAEDPTIADLLRKAVGT